MNWLVLPTKRSPAVAEEIRTDVHQALHHLLTAWREDPDRLAVALAAWCLAGYAASNSIDAVASGYPEPTGYISDDQAREYIEKAIRGRHSRVLRLRGEGLLLGLEALSTAWERDRLHAIQVDAAVIECRVLDIEERLKRLREEAPSAMGGEQER